MFCKKWEDLCGNTLILIDVFFSILLFRPHERTMDDLEIIYDELLHVKALSHLSSLVKRELASVLIFEAHPFKGELCKNDKTSFFI